MKKDQLLPRERVIEALALREPDRVPWVEIEPEQKIVGAILGKPYTPVNKPVGLYNRDVEEEKAFSRRLGKDNIVYSFRPPIFCDFVPGEDGILFYGKGHIRCRDDLKKMVFPDLESKKYFKPASEFVRKKEEFAALATTRLGFAATMLSVGMMKFFELLYEDRDFLLEVMNCYTQWLSRAMKIVSELGFDFVSASDDMAMKTGPMISPNMIEDFFLPPMQKVARSISIPWITHSDGNMLPMIDIWLQLEQNGIHPIEPAAMDIRKVKEQYGSRICIIGNVDVDLLSNGTPKEIEEIIRALIHDIAPGGGYILSSGNSFPSYAKVENVLAMGEGLRKYGHYPIDIKE
ncbi:MAG TPA: uroporphyrinogen decarboxylase family protein [Desulfobacterales bacterium]|nr:uroporphyrinogen decarboxylase family protein [Desulfobacterales bacterium]